MSAVAAEPVWTLPASAFELSLSEMARDGMRGNEGIALWLGRRRGQVNEVSHVIALRGKGIARRPNVLIITPELMNEVTDVAVDLGMTLIGQVHSHPGTFVDLSIPDRKYGIKVPGFLSVVAPHYATRPGTSIANCGVHVFDRDRGYERLPSGDVARRLRVVHRAPVSILMVGGQERDR